MAAPLAVLRCTAQSTDRTNRRLPDLRPVLPRLPHHLCCPGNGSGGGGSGGSGGSSNLRKSPSGASQYLRAIPITSSVRRVVEDAGVEQCHSYGQTRQLPGQGRLPSERAIIVY